MVRCRKKCNGEKSAKEVFIMAQAALLKSEKPDITDETLQKQLQALWENWLLDQGLQGEGGEEEVEPVRGDLAEQVGVEVSKEDLGFAKTRGRSFFPAVKHPLPGCLDRIKVSVSCSISSLPCDIRWFSVKLVTAPLLVSTLGFPTVKFWVMNCLQIRRPTEAVLAMPTRNCSPLSTR